MATAKKTTPAKSSKPAAAPTKTSAIAAVANAPVAGEVDKKQPGAAGQVDAGTGEAVHDGAAADTGAAGQTRATEVNAAEVNNTMGAMVTALVAAPIARTVPPAQPDASAKSAYQVISALDHDGVRYAAGEPVLLTAKQAASLLGHTVVVPAAADATE